MEYTPDNWVIVKLPEQRGHKVVAGWSGGYLDGNYWRVNSGITKTEDMGDHYLFHGYSNSVYKCMKDREFVRMNMAGILKQMTDNGCEVVEAKKLVEND